MTPRHEILIDHSGKVEAVRYPRFTSLSAYRRVYGQPVFGSAEDGDSDVDGSAYVQFQDGTSFMLVWCADEPTEASMIAEGVGHAWGQRLAPLTNEQILDAIALGTERAMRRT